MTFLRHIACMAALIACAACSPPATEWASMDYIDHMSAAHTECGYGSCGKNDHLNDIGRRGGGRR